ncbi:MAG: polysulfide reductase NrfD [Nitrospinae bacterium]|nr:polysulfide reductase NrfD [Nitrospinota bacterium]
MIEEKWIKENLAPGVSKGSNLPFFVLALAGVVAFVTGLTHGETIRAWGALLVNFLFWTGIAMAGIVFAAIQQTTNAAWGRPIKRIAEGLGSFLPVSFIVFLVLFLGARHLYPWINEPIPAKAAWLNLPFMFIRDLAGVVLLFGLSYKFIYNSVRPDLGVINEKKYFPLSSLAQGFIKNWRGSKEEIEKCHTANYKLAPVLILAYTLVFTLLAFDLIMSITPHWYSTLFGAYFFMSNIYLGLASIILVVVFLKDRIGLDKYVTIYTFHDIGKLLFAFVLLWTYFFYSQFLVIWYGNLPEETSFVIKRVYEKPWESVAWTLLFTNFIIPFLVLLSRSIKKKPKLLRIIASIVFCGMLTERYMLVFPSLWEGHEFPFGAIEFFMTIGFFSMFVLTYRKFMEHFPMMTITDPRFPTGGHHH